MIPHPSRLATRASESLTNLLGADASLPTLSCVNDLSTELIYNNLCNQAEYHSQNSWTIPGYHIEIIGGLAQTELLTKRNRFTQNVDLKLRAYLDGYQDLVSQLEKPVDQPSKTPIDTTKLKQRLAFVRDNMRHYIEKPEPTNGTERTQEEQARVDKLQSLYVLWEIMHEKMQPPKNFSEQTNLKYLAELGVKITPIRMVHEPAQ